MKKHQEEMLFRTAANSYVEQEDAEIRKEMEEVEDVFKKMAEENTADFEKILEREFKKKNSNQPSKKPTKVPVFYKVAVILLVFTIGVGVSVVTVPALRNRVVDFVNYVTGRYAEVGGSKKEEVKREESVQGEKIDGDVEYQLNYLPNGFNLSEKVITPQKISYNFTCENEEEKYIIFSKIAEAVSTNVDTEKAKYKKIKIKNIDALVSVEGKQIVIVWGENDCFLLEGMNIELDEMIKIVENIK